MLSYWNISCLWMVTCGYRNGSSILLLQVHDTLFSTMILLRHIYKFSAIAFWSLIKWFRCDVFIMSFDDFWHIVHAAVADFNCIVVENFVKFVASWKMLCYQMKECLCNVCWNGFAKGWVKPYYVLLSCFWFFWFGVVWTTRKKLRPTIKTMLSKSQNKNLTHKGTNTRKHMTQETH